MKSNAPSLGKGISLLLGLVFLAMSATQAEKASDKMTLADVPESVQKALAEYRGGAQPTSLKRELKEGIAFYEAEYREGEVTREIKLDEAGRVIEIEEEFPFSDLPQEVLQSIQAAYPDAEIEEIELKTVIFYEVELQKEGREVEVKILENGHVLDSGMEKKDEAGEAEGGESEKESEVTWDQLPEAVRAAIEQHRPGARPEKVDREVKKGHALYDTEFEKVEGVRREIVMDEGGRIVEIEDEIDPTQLPGVVREEVEKLYPNLPIKEAALKHLTYYVIEIEQDDKEIEVKALANGLILGLEDDD